MEGFTIIDGVVAIVIVVSALLAYSRGFVREVLAIAGWVAAAILAFIFADQAQPLLQQIPLPESLAFVLESCELSIIAAFAVVFAVALIVFAIFTPLFSGVVQRSALGGVDQGLGFLFGVARGVLLVAVAFFVYQTALAGQDVAMVEDSRANAVFSRLTAEIAERDPEAALGWVTRQYEQLVGTCAAPEEGLDAEVPAGDDA